jgi:hypothetical protein
MLLTSSWRSLAYASSRARQVPPSRPSAPPPMTRRPAAPRPPRGSVPRRPPQPLATGVPRRPTYWSWSAPLTLLVRGRVYQHRWRGQALLLTQSIVLIVTVEARLPPNLPFIRPGCGSRSSCCTARLAACDRGISGSIVGTLTPTACRWTTTVRTNPRTKKQRATRWYSLGRCRGASRTNTGRRLCAAPPLD